MADNFVQDGNVIDHVAAAAISSGDVVKIGQSLGVALADIANGATGPVAMRGVFTVPKVTAAVIAAGERLVWDVSAGKFDDNLAAPATGDVSGEAAVAYEAGTSSMTTLKVMFTGVPGTVT
jgi:predicted RecA/RadA family phage recombinase